MHWPLCKCLSTFIIPSLPSLGLLQTVFTVSYLPLAVVSLVDSLRKFSLKELFLRELPLREGSLREDSLMLTDPLADSLLLSTSILLPREQLLLLPRELLLLLRHRRNMSVFTLDTGHTAVQQLNAY